MKQIRFFLLLLPLLVWSCSEKTDENPLLPGPTEGRGAVLSNRFLQSVSAGQISADLKKIHPLLSAQNSIEVYRISYETIDEKGVKTRASGTVVLPVGISAPLPIVSYQHGTVVQKTSVPLYNGYHSGSFEGSIGAGFGGNGYITVFPDYLGLGDGPGLHSYVHAQSLASAVIDMIRATTHFLSSKNVAWNKQLFLCGYSEGGYATMAAQREIEANASYGLTITASAPMAGPYDMSGAMRDLMLSDLPYPYPMYLPYTVYSYMRAYGNFTLEEVFREEYAAIIPDLFDGAHSFGTVNTSFPKQTRLMFREDFIARMDSGSTHPLYLALRENDLYRWTPKSPTTMYHCTSDEQVPFRNSELTLASFHSLGATQVQLSNPGQYSHNDCANFALINAKLWFDSMKK